MSADSSEIVDIAIIGAGVIGLAIARRFAIGGQSTVVLERADAFGTETSSRNSEVIHAGLYYDPDSLKARLCVAGNRQLYAFCQANGIPHRRCGKIIVAVTEAQLTALARLRENAERSGVSDLELLSRHEVSALEPDIVCEGALFSPSTGIVDAHSLMLAMIGEAETYGAMFVCRTEVQRIGRSRQGWTIAVGGHEEPALAARTVINCAGLHAAQIASTIEDFPTRSIPNIRYARGCYFSYAGRTAFRHLIYPLPDPGGLGTHLTLDLAGAVRFGPDVEWIDNIDYTVSEEHREDFGKAIASYWPALDRTRLQPAYAGIRPKLSGPHEPAADFVVSTRADHGVPGIINLFGIESPGLTASLAIADHVFEQWKKFG